ncbi:hypothetical protein SUGI_0815870 [Cryptomeria japonica]|nr:hypothetical protein SUGI_0815870 [Cryptomeria japonica]
MQLQSISLYQALGFGVVDGHDISLCSGWAEYQGSSIVLPNAMVRFANVEGWWAAHSLPSARSSREDGGVIATPVDSSREKQERAQLPSTESTEASKRARFLLSRMPRKAIAGHGYQDGEMCACNFSKDFSDHGKKKIDGTKPNSPPKIRNNHEKIKFKSDFLKTIA